jgi:hypothetical protein
MENIRQILINSASFHQYKIYKRTTINNLVQKEQNVIIRNSFIIAV